MALFDAVVWLNCLLRQQAQLYNSCPTIHFCFDATSAGWKAAGFWGGDSDQAIALAIRQLRQLYSLRYGVQIADWHVKAHEGDPGNEAANSLTNWAAMNDTCHNTCPLLESILEKGRCPGMDWAWIFWKPEWKNFWTGSHVRIPRCYGQPNDALTLHKSDPALETTIEAHIKIKGLSANVLTIGASGDKSSNKQDSGLKLTRLHGLHAQCRKMEFNVLALQETRAKRSPGQEQPDYWTFSAEADPKGCYGAQLAFAKNIPYGFTPSGCPLYWTMKHFRIVASTPRYLAILVDAPALKLLCISAHAPHGGADDKTMLDWWQDLHQAIPAKLRSVPIWIGIDANARVGSIVTQAIGPCGAEEQDDNGEHFQNFLSERALWVPATWSQFQTGPSKTWTHPGTGKQSRNDYIAISDFLQCTECTTWVVEEVDISTVREDHAPVGILFTFTALRPSPPSGRLRVQFDREQMVAQLQSPRGSSFLAEVGSTLNIPWTIGVHEHYDKLASHVTAHVCQPFRKTAKKPIKSHMTPTTWELVCEKQQVRLDLKLHNKRANLCLLKSCFLVWSGRSGSTALVELRQHQKTAATFLYRFRQLGRDVTKAVRADDAAFFEHLAATTQHIDESGDSRALRRNLKRVLPKYRLRRKVQPLQLQHLQDQWIPHFCQLEAGQCTTFEAIADECVTHAEMRGPLTNVKLPDLPTLTEVEHELRSLANNKAAGVDGIPGEALKVGAPHLAPLFHDLMLKTVLMTQEPVQNKGGLLVPIHKGGTVDDVRNFRGILLLNVGGKILHAWLRKRMLALLQPAKPPGQLGGFPGQQVLFGIQSLATITQIFTAKGCSMMALFIDVQSAFHHLLRELVTGIDDPAQFETALEQLSIQDAHAAAKKGELGALQEMGASPALIGLLKEVHGNTWFQVPTLPEVVKTHRGSRPGSPIADIVWHALMMSIHKEATEALSNYEPTMAAYSGAGLQPEVITWSDDLVIPIPVTTAHELLPATQHILQKTMQSFTNRGLKLNLKRGKTTGVPTFKGNGAPALPEQYLLNKDPGLDVEDANGKVWRLPLACSYRYLGACYVPEGGHEHEIARRIGIASSAYHEPRASIFQNRRIKISTRLRLLEVLIFAKLYYGVAVWTNVSMKVFKKLDAFTLKLIRRTVGECCKEGGMTNGDLLRRYNLSPTALRMTRCRLLYAAKLWKFAPQVFLDQLLCAEAVHPHAWLTQLKADLHWMETVNPVCLEKLGVQQLTIPDVKDTWRHQTALWTRVVKHTCRLATSQQQVMDIATTWYAKLFRKLQDGGMKFNYNPLELQSLAGAEDTMACWCGRRFGSLKALSVHQWQAHQQHAPEFWLVRDPICPCCLRNFWTVARARQHLAYIPRRGGVNHCYQQLILRGVHHSEHAIEDVSIPEALKGINRLEATAAQGPKLPDEIPGAREIERAQTQLQELQQRADVMGLCVPWMTYSTLSLWQTLDALTMQKTICIENGELDTQDYDITDDWLEALHVDYARGDIASPTSTVFMRWGQYSLPVLIETYGQGLTENYLEQSFYYMIAEFDEFKLEGRIDEMKTKIRALEQRQIQPTTGHRPPKAGPATTRGPVRGLLPHLTDYITQEAFERDVQQMQFTVISARPAIPALIMQPAVQCYIILHLFSGRRRSTDFHSHLQHMARQSGYYVCILSLDVAVDETKGDLHPDSQNWEKAERALANGWIAATIAGSPCNTYSEARHYKPDDVDTSRWPRPLRSALAPWGLPGLRSREMKSLLLGSSFALQTMWGAGAMLATGGVMLSEHPGTPAAADRVSVWRLSAMQLLLTHPAVHLHHVPQGLFGATSWKRTGLLAIGLPHLERSMKRWRTSTPPTEQAIGLGPDGFRTALLKEYPREFSGALAQVIHDHLQSNPSRTCENVDPEWTTWLREAHAALSEVQADKAMKPDLQV